jgi:hypothetical protein
MVGRDGLHKMLFERCLCKRSQLNAGNRSRRASWVAAPALSSAYSSAMAPEKQSAAGVGFGGRKSRVCPQIM